MATQKSLTWDFQFPRAKTFAFLAGDSSEAQASYSVRVRASYRAWRIQERRPRDWEPDSPRAKSAKVIIEAFRKESLRVPRRYSAGTRLPQHCKVSGEPISYRRRRQLSRAPVSQEEKPLRWSIVDFTM